MNSRRTLREHWTSFFYSFEKGGLGRSSELSLAPRLARSRARQSGQASRLHSQCPFPPHRGQIHHRWMGDAWHRCGKKDSEPRSRHSGGQSHDQLVPVPRGEEEGRGAGRDAIWSQSPLHLATSRLTPGLPCIAKDAALLISPPLCSWFEGYF